MNTNDVLTERISQLEKRLDDKVEAEQKLTKALRSEDQIAIHKAEVATEAARIALRSEAEQWKKDHNNLIAQLEAQGQMHSEALVRLVSTLVTKESSQEATAVQQLKFERIDKFQNRIAGGLLVVAAIGIGNLVKVWTG